MLKMWITRWNRNFIDETRAQAFDGSDRCQVIGITSDCDGLVNRPNEWRNSTTSFKRVPMAAKFLANLVTDVPGRNPNMLGIADSKIDVPNIGAIRQQNAEVISRNETARQIAGFDLNKVQSRLAEGQTVRWRLKNVV